MIEIALQIKEGHVLYPYSPEDAHKLKNYSVNQVVHAKIKGVTKQRSYEQLRAYWAACKTVADNTESHGWQTKEQVDLQCRVALHFYDPTLIIAKPDGSIAVNYRSISFVNLKHIDACDYFTKSLEVMASKIGVAVKELIKR